MAEESSNGAISLDRLEQRLEKEVISDQLRLINRWLLLTSRRYWQIDDWRWRYWANPSYKRDSFINKISSKWIVYNSFLYSNICKTKILIFDWIVKVEYLKEELATTKHQDYNKRFIENESYTTQSNTYVFKTCIGVNRLIQSDFWQRTKSSDEKTKFNLHAKMNHK